MLINDQADSRRSVVVELIIYSLMVLAVAVLMYQIQHRPIHQQQSSQAIQSDSVTLQQ